MLENYSTYEGRLSRLGYFKLWVMLAVLVIVAQIILTLPLAFFPLPAIIPGLGTLSALLMFAVGVLVFAANLCLTIRRWHDMDCSGWYSILNFVPLVNVVAFLVLLFMPGTPGRNRFGSAQADVPAARPAMVATRKKAVKKSKRKSRR